MSLAFTCSHCHKLLKKPVQSTNGHRSCEECFNKRSPTIRCQLCEKDGISPSNDCFRLGEEQFFADRAVVYDMYKLEARCRTCGLYDSYFEIMQVPVCMGVILGSRRLGNPTVGRDYKQSKRRRRITRT